MTPRRIPIVFAVALSAVLIVPTGDVRASKAVRDASCGALATRLVQMEVTTRLARNVILDRSAREMMPADEAKDRVWPGEPVAAEPPSPMPAPETKKPKTKKRKARRSSAPSRSRADKAGSSSGPSRYSRTNTQELSVDEGDIVKTDGRHIYHVSSSRRRASGALRNEIRIYKSWPVRQAALVGRYEIPPQISARGIDQIYLYDGYVALLTKHAVMYGARGRSEVNMTDRANTVLNQNEVTRVLVIDVRHPSRPTLVRHVDVDGRFVQSRMIGSRLYVATTSSPLRLPPSLIEDIDATVRRGAGTDAATLTADLADRWNGFENVDLGLPRARDVAAKGHSRTIYHCSDLRYDEDVQAKQLLNLAQVDLTGETPIFGAGVNGYSTASKVYASEASFYVADPTPPVGRGWSTQTMIRKFDLGRGGKPRFVARGDVRGHPLNQFAMSEYQGRLRIATSDGWASNNVYVLETHDDRLATVGKLENLARNERIFAVRMMGAKGYVVTFRRTDPLFTLDLSDPNQPRVIGALKIEGFSNYLHPLDDDHLLAVGQDADRRGRSTGFHLQIFDVSDPRNPRRTHHEKLEAGSHSASQTDHHAFMYEPQTKTLALPWKGTNYWGLIAYKVDTKRGFTNLGRVNHAVMYKQFFRQQCRGNESTECGRRNYWWRFFTANDLEVDRVVAIDDHLYSFSRSGMLVHEVGRRLRQRRAVLVSEPTWRPSMSLTQRAQRKPR